MSKYTAERLPITGNFEIDLVMGRFWIKAVGGFKVGLACTLWIAPDEALGVEGHWTTAVTPTCDRPVDLDEVELAIAQLIENEQKETTL